MSKGKLPLSVAIITYNEEDIIGRTLEAVKDIASEIVVVDSHSTDRTREIAESYGAKVFVEDWKGYSGQKNSALEKCSQEWVLFLDADEVVSEELKESIAKELQNPRADGYLINRRTYYMGKFLKYAWQPEWRTLLVNKRTNPVWVGEPHAFISIKAGKTYKLKGDLYHFSYKNLKEHIRKLFTYSGQAAIFMYKSGRKCRSINLIFNPMWAFLKVYILQRGILDGIPGLVASFMTMVYTFFKYAFLYELQMKDKYGKKLWQR